MPVVCVAAGGVWGVECGVGWGDERGRPTQHAELTCRLWDVQECYAKIVAGAWALSPQQACFDLGLQRVPGTRAGFKEPGAVGGSTQRQRR